MFFKSKNSIQRKKEDAQHLVHMARKVFHYKKDRLSEEDYLRLKKDTKGLEAILKKDDVDAKTIDQAIHSLDVFLKKIGKPLYPLTTLGENVETLLISAILAIAVRAFFFQPFAIPTDSMYPTYSGLRPFIYTQEAPRPSFPKSILSKVLWWKDSFTLEAPSSGHLRIPVFGPEDERPVGGIIRYELKSVPKWILFKEKVRDYTLWVGDSPVHLELPLEFNLEEIIAERFLMKGKPFPTASKVFYEFYQNQRLDLAFSKQVGLPVLKMDIAFQRGDQVLDFDIGVGDMLFVDRFTYHFRQPRIGEPIVFDTNQVPALRDNRYYIKRLVAKGGDTLEVKDGTLFRNGKPIEGAAAFDKNAAKEGLYFGYTHSGRLREGAKEVLPEDHFYGMGDHSCESRDSRSFGPIPKKSQFGKPVIGKALFIYYPFSERWGPAR